MTNHAITYGLHKILLLSLTFSSSTTLSPSLQQGIMMLIVFTLPRVVWMHSSSQHQPDNRIVRVPEGLQTRFAVFVAGSAMAHSTTPSLGRFRSIMTTSGATLSTTRKEKFLWPR